MGASKGKAPIRRDWFSKSLAGALLGFSLAIACSGLFTSLSAGMGSSARAQLAMWMISPIWLLTWSLVYFFASGWRAWLGLGGANALVFAVWAWARL